MSNTVYYVMPSDFSQYKKPWERAAKFLKQTFNISSRTSYSVHRDAPLYIVMNNETNKPEWPWCVRAYWGWSEDMVAEERLKNWSTTAVIRLRPDEEEILIL